MAKGKEKSPEEIYADKLDMCITDGIVKTGSGVLLGALTSVLFLGRRRWPVIAGMGMGIGLAYANCEYALNTKKDNAL
ncbi:MICOS complex subunit MIC10-like [Anticarsia gemmatalis]|uniref:MICOS complex subunit MIC10-like n=1 Tax=Anticarsia gemmatalis TaxID=129554 RepID=UPI003F7601D3